MLDFFRSDLFLMRKMKATYILPVIFLLSALLLGVIFVRFNPVGLLQATGVDYSSYVDPNVNEGQSFGEQYANSLSGSLDVSYDVGYDIGDGEDGQAEVPEKEKVGIFSGGAFYDASVCDFFVLCTSSTELLILTGLFSAFLFAIDIRGGFRKNIIKNNPNRFIPFCSKIMTVLVYNILFIVFAFVCSFLVMALMGKSITMGFSAGFFGVVALRVLLTFAFSMLIALITIFTKSTAIGMIADIIFGMGALNLAFYLLDILIAFIAKKQFDFSLSDYTITGVSAMVDTDMSSKIIIRALVVSLCFIVVSVAGSAYFNQKRDIH